MHRRTLLKLLTYYTINIPLYLKANIAIPKKHKRLILIELQGGNNGLNTIIPYSNPTYYHLRPNISIPKNRILTINKDIGFHPAMSKLKDIFDAKELSIVQGVGYPNPNRSHFRSIEIWNTASKSDEYLNKGWLNQFNFIQKPDIKGIVLAGDYGPLAGESKQVIKLHNIQQFLHQALKFQPHQSILKNDNVIHILNIEQAIQKNASILKASLQNPKAIPFSFKASAFSQQMHRATKIINSAKDIPFLKVTLASFDTHMNQSKIHTRLLTELSEGISTLRDNLIKSGEWENTTIMTYSEFGRRVSENASEGTDHGTASVQFIIGGSIKGGVYGTHPSLDNLDKNGDLIYHTDFRTVYKNMIKSIFDIEVQ